MMMMETIETGQITIAHTSCARCEGLDPCCGAPNPNCKNCSQSNQKGQRSGLKLFWPRPNDRRRTIISKEPLPSPLSAPAGKISDARFVHTSLWDVELYHNMTSSVSVHSLSLLNVPELWNPYRLETRDLELLEYFHSIASTSLAIFGHSTTSLRNVLVQIALEEETASAAAVFQALLAFSSLHRHGLQSQAVELKISALGKLAEGSAVPSLSAKEAIQHIAAGMLICSFEVHQSSCTSGQWTGYLGGVKTIINEFSVDTLLHLFPDAAVLLDWVHYHDVLARFSLLYWKRGGAPKLPWTPTDFFSAQISSLPPPVSWMLNLLSQVCDTVSNGTIMLETNDSMSHYKGLLEVIDWKIRSLPMPNIVIDNDDVSDDATLIMELYRLAMLVHLSRSSEGLIDQPKRIQQHIDKAFTIFPRLSSCTQQFPIHVLGCEARTDEQRAVILDVISRTEQMSSSRSFNYCKRILQAVWAQDDLAYGNNISYRNKLTWVMGHCVIVPSFV